MSELLEAAIKVLEYVNIEIEVHKVTKVARLRVELPMRGCTYVDIIPEGDDVKPSFLSALVGLSAAVDAQIEADTAREYEAHIQERDRWHRNIEREYRNRLEVMWQGVDSESDKGRIIAGILKVNEKAGEGE